MKNINGLRRRTPLCDMCARRSPKMGLKVLLGTLPRFGSHVAARFIVLGSPSLVSVQFVVVRTRDVQHC